MTSTRNAPASAAPARCRFARHFVSAAFIAILAGGCASTGEKSPGAAAPAARPPAPRQAQAGFAGPPGTEFGFATFQTQCTTCHGNPAVERAPSPAAIREMSPEKIYTALVTGVMQAQGADAHRRTEARRRRVHERPATRQRGERGAAQMPNRCASNPPLTDPAASATWNGWGVDEANTPLPIRGRSKTRGARRAHDSSSSGRSASRRACRRMRSRRSRPAAYSSAATTASSTRSMQRPAACTGRSRRARSSATRRRSAPSAAMRRRATPCTSATATRTCMRSTRRPARCCGRRRRTNTSSRASRPAPNCMATSCSCPCRRRRNSAAAIRAIRAAASRGSVVALDAHTGKQIWKAWVIPEEPKPYKTQANGVTLYKPAGGAVWNTPTVDPARHAVYFGTGDATTAPSPKTTDGFMAVDIDTGKLLWSYQATENDVFMGGCNRPQKSEACPEVLGPDMDIGNSPILTTAPNGKRVLLGGTKAARRVRARSRQQRRAAVSRESDAARRPAATRASAARIDRVGRRGRRSARLLRHGRGWPRGHRPAHRRDGVEVHAEGADPGTARARSAPRPP